MRCFTLRNIAGRAVLLGFFFVWRGGEVRVRGFGTPFTAGDDGQA